MEISILVDLNANSSHCTFSIDRTGVALPEEYHPALFIPQI